MIWSIATSATVAAILVVWLTYSSMHNGNNPAKGESAETENPASPPAAQGGEPVQRQSESPTTKPSQPLYEVALLDLTNASATRSIDQTAGSNPKPIEIRRGFLAVTAELPAGSSPGSYEVEILDSRDQAVRVAKGQAAIENGSTKLRFNLDTRPLSPGEYQFAWRLVDFSWRQYPILIR